MLTIKVDEEITLRQLMREDADIIFMAIDKNRDHLRTWLPFVDMTKDVENTRSFIHSLGETVCPKKDMVFRIDYRSEFAGLIGLKEIDTLNKKTEVGYWLTEQLQGKGLVIRSAKAIIRYAFEEIGMNRIQIKLAVGNEKSRQIPFRLKFHFEGLERAGELVNGKFLDLQVYSLLKKEWLKLNKYD